MRQNRPRPGRGRHERKDQRRKTREERASPPPPPGGPEGDHLSSLVFLLSSFAESRMTRRREVKDGIKLRAQEGDIGESWWADKWLRVLEGFGWQSRLDRGKHYARSGQVMEYEIKPGK